MSLYIVTQQSIWYLQKKPECSISYISAIERGKIRPSLKALSSFARRLDVPLTFLLEGSPARAAEVRTVVYSSANAGPGQKVDIDLRQAKVLLQQGEFKEAGQLLAPIQMPYQMVCNSVEQKSPKARSELG